jgi:putative flavoprotein involved in K+ transport
MADEEIQTAVIGGSQAGLAVGFHLARRRLPCVILDEHERVGEAWRRRWESLRLFTPARYSGLPGMPFPGPAGAYPTKDQVADYLEAYTREFALPVRTGVRVERVSAVDGRFAIRCGASTIWSENVVVATGAYHHPRVPSFAAELDPAIVQLHSQEYRHPSQVREGGVLVVGAGNSGAEIALELAQAQRVWLSGPDTGEEPTRAGSGADRLFTPVMWLVATRLTVRTWLGRKLRDHFLDPPRGIPLGRVRRKDFAAAGVERVPRVIGTSHGDPVVEGGRRLHVANVVWCTGFIPRYDWIDAPFRTSRSAWPVHERGIAAGCPGLYFVGLPFLYSLSSALLGGVGRDAAFIADHIAAVRASGLARPG